MVVCYNERSLGLSQFFIILLKLSFSVIVYLHFLLFTGFHFAAHFSHIYFSPPLFVFVNLSSLSSFTPSPYSHPIFLFFYQWEVRNSVSEALSKKIHCFDKCFKSKLVFIALRQIIDEECLFASTQLHSRRLLVVWEYHCSMPYTTVLYKITLLIPVTTWWDKSISWTCHLLSFYQLEYIDWFTQETKTS